MNGERVCGVYLYTSLTDSGICLIIIFFCAQSEYIGHGTVQTSTTTAINKTYHRVSEFIQIMRRGKYEEKSGKKVERQRYTHNTTAGYFCVQALLLTKPTKI